MARPPCPFKLAFALFILSSSFTLIIKLPSPAEGHGGGGCGGATALFIFGDSYFDPGNNNYINTTTLDQANFWPYGESFFNFPTGRFSNGRLISDFIAEYAKLPQLIPPFLQPGNGNFQRGANFASAGAGVLVETFRGSVIDLKTQLGYYRKVEAKLRQELGEIESKTIISNAVYLFSIGTNDYLTLFLTNSTLLHFSSHPSFSSNYVNMVLGNLTNVVRAVYEKGGRKFVFMNLGDLGCLPGLRILPSQSKGGCLEEASALAKLHNFALYNLLSKLEHRFKGFKYLLWDFNTALRLRMNHPSRFGLEEGRAACCGAGPYKGIFSCGGRRRMVAVKEFELCENPNVYVFWDSYHLTQSLYSQMAAEMWNGPPAAEYSKTRAHHGHINLKALFHSC